MKNLGGIMQYETIDLTITDGVAVLELRRGVVQERPLHP